MDPRPYDLSDPAEVQRLYREVRGYLRVSIHDGTDRTGRRYALEALERLCEEPAPAPIPYRQGLPSVEEVRAHEERGGWWQAQGDVTWSNGETTHELRAHRLTVEVRERWLEEWALDRTLPDDGNETEWTYRPCLPDGTPCAWPDTAPPVAQPVPQATDPARRAAIGLLRTYWLHADCRLRYRANAGAVLEALRVLAPDLAARWEAVEDEGAILRSIGALDEAAGALPDRVRIVAETEPLSDEESNKCYLIATIDTETHTIKGVFSASDWPVTQLGTNNAQALLWETSGRDYAEACRWMREHINQWMPWVKPLIRRPI